jgi:hypothetical protein
MAWRRLIRIHRKLAILSNEWNEASIMPINRETQNCNYIERLAQWWVKWNCGVCVLCEKIYSFLEPFFHSCAGVRLICRLFPACAATKLALSIPGENP